MRREELPWWGQGSHHAFPDQQQPAQLVHKFLPSPPYTSQHCVYANQFIAVSPSGWAEPLSCISSCNACLVNFVSQLNTYQGALAPSSEIMGNADQLKIYIFPTRPTSKARHRNTEQHEHQNVVELGAYILEDRVVMQVCTRGFVSSLLNLKLCAMESSLSCAILHAIS